MPLVSEFDASLVQYPPFEMPVEPLGRPLYHITLVRRLGNAMPFVRVVKQFSFDAVMFERTPEF
jgi:hypothetical protein